MTAKTVTKNRPSEKPKSRKTVAVTPTNRAKSTSAVQPQIVGQRLIHGITNAICGAEGLSGALAVIPPGLMTKPHIHTTTESIIFVIEGWAVTLIGKKLKPVFHGPGEFIFIPDNTIHVGVNLSREHRIVALEFRTDPHISQDAHLLEGLQGDVDMVVDDLQAQFAAGTLSVPDHWDLSDPGPFRIED
jgi:uncharacterized RmlC-like cupin family protein